MKNRYVKMYFLLGIIILIFMCAAPFFLYIGPEKLKYETIYRNITFFVPIIIALFFIPIASYKLKEWDIHFTFIADKETEQFKITVSNFGETPFSFNRISFVSNRKFFSFSKPTPFPPEGIFDTNIELHGAETPSQILHEHIGYTVNLGMPVVIWIRPDKLSDYLKHFGEPRIILYFEGTEQYTISEQIPKELLDRFISN